MPVKQTNGKRRVGDGTPGPGRPKGVPNKNTRAVKEMVLEALNKAGGVKYLLTQAVNNPTAFLTLIGKTIPLSGDLNINHEWIKPLNMARTRALAEQGGARETVQ